MDTERTISLHTDETEFRAHLNRWATSRFPNPTGMGYAQGLEAGIRLDWTEGEVDIVQDVPPWQGGAKASMCRSLVAVRIVMAQEDELITVRIACEDRAFSGLFAEVVQ